MDSTSHFPQSSQDISIRILDERLRTFGLPSYGTSGSAALDLRAFDLLVRDDSLKDHPQHLGFRTSPDMAQHMTLDRGKVRLAAGMSYCVDTGFAIHIGLPNKVGLVVPRSGTGSRGLRLTNTMGVIDNDYQGRLVLMITPDKDFTYTPGDKLVQMIITDYIQVGVKEVETFTASTERGVGGFGSTGS